MIFPSRMRQLHWCQYTRHILDNLFTPKLLFLFVTGYIFSNRIQVWIPKRLNCRVTKSKNNLIWEGPLGVVVQNKLNSAVIADSPGLCPVHFFSILKDGDLTTQFLQFLVLDCEYEATFTRETVLTAFDISHRVKISAKETVRRIITFWLKQSFLDF